MGIAQALGLLGQETPPKLVVNIIAPRFLPSPDALPALGGHAAVWQRARMTKTHPKKMSPVQEGSKPSLLGQYFRLAGKAPGQRQGTGSWKTDAKRQSSARETSQDPPEAGTAKPTSAGKLLNARERREPSAPIPSKTRSPGESEEPPSKTSSPHRKNNPSGSKGNLPTKGLSAHIGSPPPSPQPPPDQREKGEGDHAAKKKGTGETFWGLTSEV